MKKISFTILLGILCINLISAQNDKGWNDRNNPSAEAENTYQWTLGFGVNAVNNSDAQFEELTNSDHWAFARIPFYLSAEASVGSNFSVGTMVSFNYFTDGKVYEGQTVLGEDKGGNDAGYVAVDINLRYSFLNSNTFEPYVSVGTGVSHFGDYRTQENPGTEVNPIDIFTLNAGLGMNVWFSPTWGVNLNATGKWGVATEYTNHSQASIGILYNIK